jgi:uncharacterized alpha-E superfamily protein
MSLRVFLARTPDGWRVMPGGYARIGRTEDPSAIAMQAGGFVADVWIVDDTPRPRMPTIETEARPRPIPGALPSRSADNLFWLGRYVERAEGSIRGLRAHRLRLAEAEQADAPLPALLRSYLRSLGADDAWGSAPGLRQALGAALAAGSRVRDRISVDGWLALNDLVDAANALGSAPGGLDADGLNALLRKCSGFAGLVHENMYRYTDWRFLTIGRCLERAVGMASALAWFAEPEAPLGALEAAVELGDSVMTHRQRYASAPTRTSVIELLVFDTLNPRSILYQLEEIRRQIAELPGAEDHGLIMPPLRAALLAQTSLAVSTPETLDTAALKTLQDELGLLSDLLTDAYLR